MLYTTTYTIQGFTFYITATKDTLYRIDFSKPSQALFQTTELLSMVKAQLNEYFSGTRQSFNLPYKLEGTPFQLSVWQELAKIPYGATTTYKEIAQRINHPKAYRAVGMANNKNPLCLIIPCHRIIGSDGSLTGYAGGLELKKFLLSLENQNFKLRR